MRLEPGTFLGPSVPHPFLYGLSKNETYTRDRRNSFAYMEGRAFRHGDIVSSIIKIADISTDEAPFVDVFRKIRLRTLRRRVAARSVLVP